MKKALIYRKFWLVLCLSLVFSAQSIDAFARPAMGGGPEGPPRRGPEYVTVGHERYRYHEGRFFMPVFFGLFEVLVDVPPVGAIVTVLPVGHRTIMVGGVTCYYYDNVYYATCPSGYVVISNPMLGSRAVVVSSNITQPQKISGEAATVNVPNSNGSYTPVMLVKQGDGYIGPQGEYYPGHPTVEQLKVLYGK